MSTIPPSGRIATAALATTATIALLLTAQTGNVSPRPADNRVTSSSGVVIFAVITRDANLGTDANAVAILNTSASSVADLLGWSLEIEDGTGATTASYTFGTTMLLPWQQVVISGPGYTPTPLTSHAIHRKFSSAGGDLIPDNFQATLNNDATVEDRVATSAAGSMNPEGGPAPAPTAATDLCEAAVRRDQSGDDTNDNADDFSLAPVLVWGTTVALTC